MKMNSVPIIIAQKSLDRKTLYNVGDKLTYMLMH